MERLINQYKSSNNLKNLFEEIIFKEYKDTLTDEFVEQMKNRLNIDEMRGKQLDMIGEVVGQPRINSFVVIGQVMTDAEYRLLLKSKIFLNNASGSVSDIMSYAKILLNTRVSIVEGLGFIDIVFFADLNDNEKILITETFRAAAGINIRYRYTSVDNETPFGFDGGPNEGFDNGVFVKLFDDLEIALPFGFDDFGNDGLDIGRFII